MLRPAIFGDPLLDPDHMSPFMQLHLDCPFFGNVSGCTVSNAVAMGTNDWPCPRSNSGSTYRHVPVLLFDQEPTALCPQKVAVM
jgi:hypothetical protein